MRVPQSYSLKLSNLMTDFTESIAFLSIVKIFICRLYSPWQIRILQTPALSSPLLILLLFPVNTNECRVLQVSLALRFKFKTDLIINWIYPIKTHGERLGASLGLKQSSIARCTFLIRQTHWQLCLKSQFSSYSCSVSSNLALRDARLSYAKSIGNFVKIQL